MIFIKLDKNNPSPLYKQLGDAVLQKIIMGELPPDSKLPTIRALAANLKVNNTTVVGAYKYLEQIKAVYSIRGSGIYVAKQKAHTPVPFEQRPFEYNNCINFASISTDPAYFPKEDFRIAFDAVITRDGAGAFGYPGWRGYAPLRETVSNLLIKNKIRATLENIQIFSDIRQGLDIILDALISPGDAVILESPTSQGAVAAFASRGIKILEIPINENGIDLDKLSFLTKKHRPKLFFLMPTYQTPTGLCYTEETKAHILELAHNMNAYIIEEDDYGDFFYGAKPTPLKAIDAHDRVIYLKSFDRVLTPGLASYMACPKDILNRLRNTSGVSGYIQRSLDFYLRNFNFGANCSEVRVNYTRRYKRAVAAAETFLTPYASFTKPEGGLSLWVRPHNANKTANYINEFFAQKVLVSPEEIFLPKATIIVNRHFRISFANANEDDISKGIGIIASVLSGKR